MAAVRRQRLFPILAEGYEHGRIPDGKKDGSLAVRLIDVLVIGPARNHEDVALLPFKADAPDDGRTSALKDVVHGTVYLAMSSRVNVGTPDLARNHEDVALLPFKADAPDDGRTSALKDVVHGTVYLAMSSRVNVGTQH